MKSIELAIESANDLLQRHVARGAWRHHLVSQSADGQIVIACNLRDEIFFAKTTSDGAAEHSYRALLALAEQPFCVLTVPRVIAFDGPTETLITTQAAGVPCEFMDPRTSGQQLYRIGVALQELHNCQAPLGDVKTMDDHLRELVRPSADVLKTEMREFAEIIDMAVHCLHADVNSWKAVDCVPLHRDFHLRQLLDDGNRVAAVDWDQAACGDPAFDVAYFSTYLKNHFSVAAAATGIESFLAGYQIDDRMRHRLTTYEMFNYLRRGCRRFRLKDCGWKASLEQMMDRLKSCIESR